MKHVIHTPLLLVAALLLVLAGCDAENGDTDAGNNNADAPQRALPVETLTLEPTRFEERVELTGSLDALDDATLSAQGNGTLILLHDLGTELNQNAVVAQLDSTTEASAVRQARAQLRTTRVQLESAEDAFRRQEPLYRDSVISAIEFEQIRSQRDQAMAGLEQAEAALEQAREQLHNTTVRMPFAGTVEEHFVRRGEQITPGTPVARVVNTDRVKVKVGVPERYIDDVTHGDEVRVDFRGLQDAGSTGRITFVGRSVSPGSRTFPVEIEIPNPDGRLKPEMTANVSLPRRQLDDVIVIPRRAAERDEDGHRAYVVVGEDEPRVENREIVLGPSFEGRVVVLDGLESGDVLVVTGQETLSSGDRVDITQHYEEIEQTLLQPRSTARR